MVRGNPKGPKNYKYFGATGGRSTPPVRNRKIKKPASVAASVGSRPSDKELMDLFGEIPGSSSPYRSPGVNLGSPRSQSSRISQIRKASSSRPPSPLGSISKQATPYSSRPTSPARSSYSSASSRLVGRGWGGGFKRGPGRNRERISAQGMRRFYRVHANGYKTGNSTLRAIKGVPKMFIIAQNGIKMIRKDKRNIPVPKIIRKVYAAGRNL